MSSSAKIRVRFAPSPTGYLHIGGARTALFNYLYARRHDGTFVLRVEDTDRGRSTPEAIEAIFDGLRYLGLEWDEGPGPEGAHGSYFQSERARIHSEDVERLVAEGKAYRCFCSRERLAELRERQRQAKERILYDRLCLESDPPDAERRATTEPHVVRFRIPPGTTRFTDGIRGEIAFDRGELEDFILRRADGSCVYNLAVVSDDHGMGITDVIRGEDHLSNTPKQILLFEALGFDVPRYAHIPLILAAGGGKLSKRHGAVSVTEFRDRGYLPAAMINFLVRMGWSYDDKEEIFSLGDLVEKFSLEGVSRSGAVYDLKKLSHLGNYYLRQTSVDELLDAALEHLVAAGLIACEEARADDARLRMMVALAKDRIECLGDLPEQVRFYFEDPVALDAGARKALRKKADACAAVKRYAADLATAVPATDWNPEDPSALESHARRFTEKEDLKLGDLAQPLRAILTGRSATPGLFEVMAILGREACLRRLERADELFAEARG